MAIQVQHVTASMEALLPADRFGVRELEEMRLILRGDSVIDWRRLNFRDREEVDAFIRLCLFRPEHPADEARLREILAEAVEYLRKEFRYRVTSAVAKPAEIHDLFLIASGVGPHKRFRRIACIVLKVMHTIFHTDSREMLFRTPISSAEFATLIDRRVQAVAAQLRAIDAPIIDFVGNVKSRESMITKLLAKRESVAAQIFDKVRYRIVTRTEADILPVLHFLTRHLFPFNFVVPAQTQNSLVSLTKLIDQTPSLAAAAARMQTHLDDDSSGFHERRRKHAINEFSGAGYRVLNLIADVPVRLDEHLCMIEGARRIPARPEIAFAPVEFQIVDEATARSNETGENSHERYKRRQNRRVLRRLSRGLVVPRRRPVSVVKDETPDGPAKKTGTESAEG
ncbi:MAG TPA: TIGR04552 family protein [Vulgatibacter sp.]|nr:TIGR04552 family protein [Vulgatibacter sp.]